MTRSSTAGGYASSSSADTKPPNNTRGGGGNKRQKKTSVAAGNGLSGDHSSILANTTAYKEEPTFEDQHNLFTPVEAARSKNDGSIGFSTLKRIFYNSGLETDPSTAQSTSLNRGIAFRDQQQDDKSAVSSQLADLKKTIETLSASNSSLAASHSWLEKRLAAQERSRDDRNQQQPEANNFSVPPTSSKRTKREDRNVAADVTMGHLPAHNPPARREFPASRNRDTAAQTSHDHSDDHSSVTGGSSVDDSRGSRKARRADYMERQRRYLLIFD